MFYKSVILVTFMYIIIQSQMHNVHYLDEDPLYSVYEIFVSCKSYTLIFISQKCIKKQSSSKNK